MTTAHTTEAAAKKALAKLQRAIVDGLEDVKAQDIRVFDTEHLSPLFERVIIAAGNSNRQTKALAASVRDKVREAGFAKPRSEGEDNGEWIIVDCGAAVCHIMQPLIRQYYRLEEIWGEKPVRMKLGSARPRATLAPAEAVTPARKTAKKAAVKKAPAKQVSAGKPLAAKVPARKTATAAKSVGAKRSPVAKSPATKSPARRASAVKTVVVNKPAAKKSAAPKATARKSATRKG